MAVFAVGDVQGCSAELRRLVDKLPFDPASDKLWFVGDLVNRGPDSLGVLRFVKELGSSAITVLGNHDLHLLALALGDKVPVTDAELAPVIADDEAEELLDWLRTLPLAHFDAQMNTLMVHAGVIPTWSVDDTLARAHEVEHALRGEDCGKFLTAMYGGRPDTWSEDLSGLDRLRFIANCLTRIRFVRDDGSLDFDHKGAPGSQPAGMAPWFEISDRATQSVRIVFGHWSTLEYMLRPGILALDTGCVWGGTLTAARLDPPGGKFEVASNVNRPIPK